MKTAAIQGVYVDVPMADWSLFKELIRKFGWQTRTKEDVLNQFVNSRPEQPALSEEDIMNEVKAVRYPKRKC